MMRELTDRVRQKARRLGFHLVGIVDPRSGIDTHAYRDWLKRGHHAGMGYLSRPDAIEKRANPGLIIPDVRSMVVVGINYYPGDFPGRTEGLGRVSRYAWGLDYHEVIVDRLQRLVDWIEEATPGHLTHRAYVDHGPLLERELARRAGLGWFGKNTNLIHPDLGSYFFLGELLLDLELEPNAPFEDDRCGSCTACLDACPTGALISPRVLDARRCISYLTIEHRGAIPAEMRPQMGDWIFGCDVCQEVCPWNKRFARPQEDSAFHPSRPTLNPIELLALDEAGFRQRFWGTPLWRPRRTGLLRNAAVVLGNVGDQTAVPALQQALSDEPLIANHAGWALGQLKGP